MIKTSSSLEQQESTDRAQRQAQVVSALQAVLPAHALLWHKEDTTPYECDGLTAYRQRPLVVALPETETQVQALLRTCHALDVPVVARGAGTGLSNRRTERNAKRKSSARYRPYYRRTRCSGTRKIRR